MATNPGLSAAAPPPAGSVGASPAAGGLRWEEPTVKSRRGMACSRCLSTVRATSQRWQIQLSVLPCGLYWAWMNQWWGGHVVASAGLRTGTHHSCAKIRQSEGGASSPVAAIRLSSGVELFKW